MSTESYTNPAGAENVKFQSGYGTTPIALPGTRALLIHQVLNQLPDCVHSRPFENLIGIKEAELEKIFDEFSAWMDKHDLDSNGVIVIQDTNGIPMSSFERMYSAVEIRAIRNALELVMLDLGQSDFFNRTGFSLAEAKELLDQFNALLLEPLHLDRTAESISH